MQGFIQLVNVLTGGDANSDPQFVTLPGTISGSKTVDAATDLVMSSVTLKTGFTVVDNVNFASTIESIVNTVTEIKSEIKNNTNSTNEVGTKTTDESSEVKEESKSLSPFRFPQ